MCAAASSGTYEEIMKGWRRWNVQAATKAAFNEAGGKKAVPGGAKPTLPFILPKFPTIPDSTGSSKGVYCFQFYLVFIFKSVCHKALVQTPKAKSFNIPAVCATASSGTYEEIMKGWRRWNVHLLVTFKGL